MTHEAVNADSKQVWQTRKSGKCEMDWICDNFADDDLVDGGEAGEEDERATQASATIIKNAAHLENLFPTHLPAKVQLTSSM